jgi:PhnB protein
MSVPATPTGMTGVLSYLYVRNAAAAIEFYKTAFGATEGLRLTMPDGTICHAEVKIAGGTLMLAEEMEQWGNKGPQTLGGASCGYMFYVDDCDAVFAQALAAGGTLMRPVEDHFYGDRAGTLVDPFGHVWTVATHKEDVATDEIERRMLAWMASAQAA